MAPFWHPLSTILLAEPACFASEVLIRTLLRAEGAADLLYAGDRMWPGISHGDRFGVVPADVRTPQPGDAVIVCPGGIPDLLRVASAGEERLRLCADADPGVAQTVALGDVLGVARLPARRVGRRMARFRRLLLDVREALQGAPDAADDPAQTVLEKYDAQAPFYADSDTPDIDPRLAERIRGRITSRGRILVVGSGSGRECFALAREGYQVTGLDFAPAMVERATREAGRRGLEIRFLLGDVRAHEFPERSHAGVLFTYDVYSFIPRRADRIEVLARMRSLLEPAGRVFLSARRRDSAFDRTVLSLQWAAAAGRGEWGDSHTRWIAVDGRLCRSFVRVFSPRQLASEIDAAGFALEGWEAGHGALAPRLL